VQILRACLKTRSSRRLRLSVALVCLILGQVVGSQALAQTCARWVQRTDVGTPGKRISHAMAYDSDRGVTVFFGGEYSDAGSSTISYYNDTWEYNSGQWRKIKINGSIPDVRSGHAMAYDLARKRVVLFGGVKQDGVYFGDTWTYFSDGTNGTWAQASLASGPSPRAGHEMAYDAQHQRVIMYGGLFVKSGTNRDISEAMAETWEWDGGSWTGGMGFGGTPDGQHVRGSLAYDSVRAATVLFGGVSYSLSSGIPAVEQTFSDFGTWEYQDHLWKPIPGDTPPPRQQHAMAFDSMRAAVILFGGTGYDPTIGGKTDQYVGGVGWQSLLDSGPPPRARHAMVYDSKRQRIVLFGGVSGDTRYDDTWELVNTGPTFTQQPTNQTVGPCSLATFQVAVTGDPPQAFHWAKDGQPLTDGGRSTGVLTDTLKITETEFGDEGYYAATVTSPCGTNTSIGARLTLAMPWSMASNSGPQPRYQHGMAYDEARGVTVLFGGQLSGNIPNGETWEWNGNTWFLVATNGPSPRFGVSMAHDSNRGKTVLFGGNVNSTSTAGDYRGQTWEWDGSTWTLRTTNGPAARAYAPMVYDSATKRCVLFGGYLITNSNLSRPYDTWEYDGQSGAWVQIADGGPKPLSGEEAMAYDSQRNRRVLFTDGLISYGESPFLLVWEWDGTNWVRQSPQLDPHLASYLGAPSKVSGESIAYHRRRKQVIINNGNDGNFVVGTWAYDGVGWKLLTDQGSLHAEQDGKMVYDTARDALVEFGGADNHFFVGGETWELVDADLIQILKQPVSVRAGSNQVARFTVTVRGKPPLQYQWRRNGVGLADDGRISGANSGTLTIKNVNSAADLGSYDVVITNDCGAVMSAPASLQFVSVAFRVQLDFVSDHWVLEWPVSGAVLESATRVTGPWSPVTGASSPFPLVTNQPARFFRLRQP
jgi:hypothetical protein